MGHLSRPLPVPPQSHTGWYGLAVVTIQCSNLSWLKAIVFIFHAHKDPMSVPDWRGAHSSDSGTQEPSFVILPSSVCGFWGYCACLHPSNGSGKRRGNRTHRTMHHSAHIPWIRAPSLGHTYLQKEAGKCNLRVGPEGREKRLGEQPGSLWSNSFNLPSWPL